MKVVRDSWEEIYHLQEQAEAKTFLQLAGRMDGIEFRKALDDVLSELPPEKKEVFILKYQEEKSIAEIAEIQGCPEGSVKSRLHYTLKVLEQRLRIFNPVLS